MSSLWQVVYFIDKTGKNPVEDFLARLSRKQRDKILHILLYIQEYGLVSAIPHTKKLTGTALWEIRILGKDNIRVIYVLSIEYTVLILHGFIKKKQKTPLKEIQIALNRYEEWKKIQKALDV